MLGSRNVALLSVMCLALSCGQTGDDPPAAVSGSGGTGPAGAGPTNQSGNPSGTSGTATIAGGGTSSGGSTSGTGGVAGDGAIDESGGAIGAGGADLIDPQTILETYRGFAPQTPKPVNVSGYIFGLCRLPTLPEEEFAASIHGDERYLQDWANPLAVEGLAKRGDPEFPPGAVIAKEKYAGPQATEAELVAIGIMIKRRSGFDPAHGDWDYAYYEPALGVIQTAEQSKYCAGCHAGAAETDFVFVDGLGR